MKHGDLIGFHGILSMEYGDLVEFDQLNMEIVMKFHHSDLGF